MKIKDQIGHVFIVPKTPLRIISLVPSQTELLYELGLEDEVVGITKFCVHPKKWHKNKTRVGGTKNINFEKIEVLQPDLIIANKEENTQSEIEALQKLYPVYTSDISNLEESLGMIRQLGEILDKTVKTNQIISKIETGFNQLSKNNKTKKATVLYLIWQKPLMSIGADSFINDMLLRCGFDNVLADKKRYPEIDAEDIKELNPTYIFLSSEPYPFKEKHIRDIQKLAPTAKVILVDGEYFSWYGSRLLNSSKYFVDLINNLP